jgi:hypothetical protein
VSNGTTATYLREADNKHPGTMISGGFTTGGVFAYGAATLSPQISVDGLLMREEGYTEKNPFTTTVGDGFDLKVQPYYAKSLRVFLGGSVRYDLDLWDFYLQPEAHAGFRYDFFNDPAKLKAAFAYADTSGGTAGRRLPRGHHGHLDVGRQFRFRARHQRHVRAGRNDQSAGTDLRRIGSSE